MHKNASITPKERLLNVLNKVPVDRPPVICPGGMMNAAVTEVVENLPFNHNITAEGMILAAKAVYAQTGFENYGVPFCMTCEAEPLNPHMDQGSIFCEPKITEYMPWPDENTLAKAIHTLKETKCKEVIKAIEALKNDKIPVIGNITGPISTATSVVDPIDFFKAMRKSPEQVHLLLHHIQAYLVYYAQEMIAAGADLIVMSDPTATGEIIGIRYFEQFALPLYKAFTAALDVPVILHICGNTQTVLSALSDCGACALSFDSMVSISQIQEHTTLPIMGNINTLLLQQGPLSKIEQATKNAIASGVSIVAPACGLGMSTPIENLKTMTNLVKMEL